MNPTDQARKEARRRELRKNKKQRLAVRQAVIKTKDPKQMLAELDTLDEMELNPSENLPYNDKVVKEKRVKLLENIQRITQYYLREDPEQGTELKILLDNYRKDRLKKEVYYESVRNAQKVKIDSIPLPDAPFQTPQLSDIPLPGIQPPGILKKNVPYSVGNIPEKRTRADPPGPPPGPPPLKKSFKGNKRFLHPKPPPGLPPVEASIPSSVDDDKEAYDPEEGPILGDVHSDSEDEDIDHDDVEAEKSDDEFYHRDDDFDDSASGNKRRLQAIDEISDEVGDKKHRRLDDSGVTPLQAMMLKLAGQSVPNKKPEEEDDISDDEDDEMNDKKRLGFAETQQKPPPGPPPGLPPGPPRLPPDVATGRVQSRILPPGPPPGHPPTLPPGPPPGLPPTLPMRMGMMPTIPQQPDRFNRNLQPDNPVNSSNILSAPPSLIQYRQEKEKDGMPAMIVAKPKIINNPKADVTRFMPTSLRVKRQSSSKIGPNRPSDVSATSSSDRHKQEKNKKGKLNADVAYDSFMKEMQGFL